jgi:hypothetical protein
MCYETVEFQPSPVKAFFDNVTDLSHSVVLDSRKPLQCSILAPLP